MRLGLPRSTKNTAGYALAPGMDWVDLFIGSEGTLGIVAEAELALLPVPGALLTGVAFFPGDGGALGAVEAWRPVPDLRMLEYLDAPSLDLLRPDYPEIPAAARACLLYEQQTREAEGDIEAWLERLEAAGADLDASWLAASDKDRERFRRFRHALPERVNATVRANGFQKLGSDFAVPLNENAGMLAFCREELEREFPGRYVIFGHIGDAHLHANILPSSEEEVERGKQLMVRLARQAASLGGTVSAEHGLGKRKRGLLSIQYTAEEIAAMCAVKRRLDPGWLLGRGNLFPAPEEE
jgi:FAD/FMN-containing dehydrogenase